MATFFCFRFYDCNSLCYVVHSNRNVVELNTVGSIPSFNLQVVNKLPQEMEISLLPGNSLLFSRFLPYNIMHVIHDDLLGVYFTLVEYFSSDDMEKEAYDLSTRYGVINSRIPLNPKMLTAGLLCLVFENADWSWPTNTLPALM